MTEAQKIKQWFTQLTMVAEQQFDIHIAADGRWFHQGGEIRRAELVRLFASVLMRDEQGEFWLVTPVEKGRISVDDAPFIITEARFRDAAPEDEAFANEVAGDAETRQIILMRTNVGDEIQLGAAHPLRMMKEPGGAEMRPYVMVRDGLLAKLSRPVYYQLAAEAVPGPDGRLGVWSGSVFFPLEA